MSRIVSFIARVAWPFCLVYGLYVIIHGHLTPGGGFQGGAVMATGAALMMVSGAWDAAGRERHERRAAFFETLGLVGFVAVAFGGLLFGAAFFHNWLANTGCGFFGLPVEPGPNPGVLRTAGTLPLMNLAVGIEVFGGISVILCALQKAFHDADGDETPTEESPDDD
jgi:multicomponent Na+:H+ antiporter subunit B